jgi:DNA polymerase-3 subunit delta'
MFWALLLNCSTLHGGLPKTIAPRQVQPSLLSAASPAPQASMEPARNIETKDGALPCLNCLECLRMIVRLHRDFFFLDGLAGSITIGDVRAMRGILDEPPREARYRVVIFREAQALVEAAANALLKSFEEPRQATSFVLLAPQRERLLPTLASRSFTLTLPWPESFPGAASSSPATVASAEPSTTGSKAALAGTEDSSVLSDDDPVISWEAELCLFLNSGRGWFDRTAIKGAVGAPLVHGMLRLCRRALASRILALRSGAESREGLESFLARLPEQRLRMVDEILAECQDSLLYAVNPTLVLEWMATRLYLLLPK